MTTLKTMHDWNLEGKRVRKGVHKSGTTVGGTPLFSEAQVYTPVPVRLQTPYSQTQRRSRLVRKAYGSQGIWERESFYGDDDYERDAEEGFCYGVSPWGNMD